MDPLQIASAGVDVDLIAQADAHLTAATGHRDEIASSGRALPDEGRSAADILHRIEAGHADLRRLVQRIEDGDVAAADQPTTILELCDSVREDAEQLARLRDRLLDEDYEPDDAE